MSLPVGDATPALSDGRLVIYSRDDHRAWIQGPPVDLTEAR
ncbi:hypothetical protein SAMN05216388_101750 [Halorientalis persicus]|uniref:Uncharacterized protein n=1 Tax=Halorientalis persicus TaxID=1367881 RepID=A0A1H8RVM0_9EURY|nr:hypothetical protein [Halorientalis persicus]SEO70366.1 hypothetical protein SAMN05216388_101750 [Halorientalis persicus]